MSSTTEARRARPSARWLLPECNPEEVERLRRELRIGQLAASILARRGFSQPEEAQRFLEPSLDALHPPERMQDMSTAADRIQAAIGRKEAILLYGDYDVDGTTSIVILKTALELLNAKVRFHVPHRIKDGYGMRSEVIQEASEQGVRLIVSVDTGIRANKVVREARELGIDVIVTDHHLPETELPPALAVLNPNRRDCGYPEKHLCGAGVAFKLIQALLERSEFSSERRAKLLDSFLKLVAIATIADIVPLMGENRVIVRRGLAGLARVKNAGLRALLGVSGLTCGLPPSTHQVAFRIAPRINAAGRMASARDVIDLFLTNDENRAQRLAEQLDVLNRERQQAEAEIIETILKQCETMTVDDSAALVFAESGWHLGVVGIVASRLVERFARPVIVLSDAAEEGFFSGSGRSIPRFHLLEALENMAHLFHKFGGHRQAAGLTMKREHVDEFRQKFHLFASERLTPDDLRPEFTVDAAASFSELDEGTIREIFAMAPFGFGNPVPVLLARQAEVAGPPRALSEGKHLRIPLKHGGRMLWCKAWNFGDRAALFEPGAKLDVLFTVDDDPGSKARGYDGWSFTLKDAQQARSV
jgi:single-stranded-DNA-specific exonuclease